MASVLVVTANWAFTDGTLVATAARAHAARQWLRAVSRATIRSGFGRDGSYRPPAALDVVLAGDTFDARASAAWHGRDRPWHGGARAVETRRRVLRGCARRAAPFLAGLARLARSGLAAPAADSRGRPSVAAPVRVPVRVALLAGDRDHDIPEAAADTGTRDVTVASAWSDGTVLARHGHEFDPACQFVTTPPGHERPPTLAESMAIDLVGEFAVRLAATGVPPRATAPLIEVLLAAGPADVPAALAAWAAADGPAAVLGGAVRDVAAAWCRAVDGWLRAARRDPPECGLHTSPLEELAEWFRAAATVPRPAFADRGTTPPPQEAASAARERPRPCHRADPRHERLDDVFHVQFDRRLPATFTLAGTARAVVLGHPSSRQGAGAICLGRPPLRRWGPLTVGREAVAADVTCVVAAPAAAGPATITCRRDDDGLEWQWLGQPGAPAAEPTVVVAVVDAA